MPEDILQPNAFRWTESDVYLFDIDGTLLNTRDLVHWHALNRAMLEVYGVNTTIAGISYHGKTDLGILRAALERAGISNGTFEQKLPLALHVVRQHVSENATQLVTDVCCAIPEILARLHGSGKLLGVASGNLESVGWKKVEAAGLRHYFQFGCFSDRDEFRADIFKRAVAEARSRAGQHAKVCFVGDTPEDIRAARSAGAHIIAVATGVYKADELSLLGADACVASCSDLV
jgi:phosphoglycolate phosphatase